MAKFVKLQISGIRSFGPFEGQDQKVKFTSPLTLILGQYGCGKTTIIDAMMYACTGELPDGSDSGRGFVHDPRLTRSSSTKGQIKLQFQDVKGNKVIICRAIEVTRNTYNNNLKVGTKFSAIRVLSPDGTDRRVSGQDDVTMESSQLLNAAPSVLNNVMFCHQKNSAWPLDEKKLKEIFDEIFCMTNKYNKAAESMRALHEQKLNNLKVLETELKNLKDKKDEIEKQKRRLRDSELRKARDRSAHDRYLEKLYEYKVKDTSIKDLYKYIQALEKAVLEFHKEKMTEINKNIRDLWRDIYRGNDIDFIEIKTEQATRRVYYKVLQVNKGVALEMRGRCSAGQEALACFVIRIALAKALRSKCGILVLDEPTVYFDKETKQSLGETLSRLLTENQREKNLQLLLITHDEEFVRFIKSEVFIPYIHRLDRDSEGFSRITKEY